MNFKQIKNEFQDQVVAVETISGDKLIGFIVEPPNKDSFPLYLPSNYKDGLWLSRRMHLTYLSKQEIKNIRLARYLEKEFDNSKNFVD